MQLCLTTLDGPIRPAELVRKPAFGEVRVYKRRIEKINEHTTTTVAPQDFSLDSIA